MAGAGGRDVHPRSTHGVLIRIYPNASFKGAAAAQTAVGPLADPGLSGIDKVIVAVNDLDQACDVYGQKLALAGGRAALDGARGVRAASYRAPAGGSIELVSVADPSRPFADAIAEFTAGGREGMFALVLQSGDLEETRSALTERGLVAEPAADDPRVLEIDRASVFGARIRIEAAPR